MLTKVWQRLTSIASRITGISTPFGGLSWSNERRRAPEVPVFQGGVSVTGYNADDFVDFLAANVRRIVYLDAYLDAGLGSSIQFQFVERERVDLDRIVAGQLGDMLLPLVNSRSKLVSLMFHFRRGRNLIVSLGGTGVITVDVTGLYEVSPSYHGGPSTVFHLHDIDAPPDFRIKMQNKREAKQLARGGAR